LREFVEPRAPQETPDARRSFVIGHPLAASVERGGHGVKFTELEPSLIEAGTLLDIETPTNISLEFLIVQMGLGLHFRGRAVSDSSSAGMLIVLAPFMLFVAILAAVDVGLPVTFWQPTRLVPASTTSRKPWPQRCNPRARHESRDRAGRPR
jgi:hypothetical protein